MQLAATVVAFGAAPLEDAARLDATALSCDVLSADFRAIKQAEGGSLLFALLDDDSDAALAAASKALSILRQRGGGEALVVLPASEAVPGPQALARLQRAAELTRACVVRPVAPASWAEAVRCFVEPLSVYGLAGVDPRELHALVRPRPAVLHASLTLLPGARDLLVTCRLRPTSSLAELDSAARAATECAPQARLLLAGPEVEDGPPVLAASLF
jgi:hypothetical protein